MINIFNFSLTDIMPQSLLNDPFVKALAQALDPELRAISNEIIKCVLLPRINSLDEQVIDHLAVQLHVDFYDTSLPLATKKTLVQNSIRWHKIKGTPAAVEEIIEAIFGGGKVIEWWEYESGEPYHFKVESFNPNISQSEADRFLAALYATKNTRSWFDGVTITLNDNLPVYYGFAVHQGDNITVEQVS